MNIFFEVQQTLRTVLVCAQNLSQLCAWAMSDLPSGPEAPRGSYAALKSDDLQKLKTLHGANTVEGLGVVFPPLEPGGFVVNTVFMSQ